MVSQNIHPYGLIAAVTLICLLSILVGFDLLPLTTGNDDLVVEQQVYIQVARSEFLAKDVLILAYRPATYHSQAISELQTVLPVFQRVQIGLLNGDAGLGLPTNPPDDVRQLVVASQSDYTALSIAVKSILAHPDEAPDPVQVNIVQAHESPYTLAIYQVAVALQVHAEASQVHLITIKIVIKSLIVLVAFLYLFRVVWRAFSDRRANRIGV